MCQPPNPVISKSPPMTEEKGAPKVPTRRHEAALAMDAAWISPEHRSQTRYEQDRRAIVIHLRTANISELSLCLVFLPGHRVILKI